MPQARLPDINTQYIKFVNEAVNSWKSKNYESCLGSLFTLNGMLPENYRVLISDEEYKKRTSEQLMLVCSECEQESDRFKIKIKHLLLKYLDSILVGKKYDDFWSCPKCKVMNKLSKTDMVQDRRKDPGFYQVSPSPPIKHDGLLDRRKYHAKFTVWFWTYIGEVIAQMAKFRDDNWTKENIYGDQDSIDTTAEENDTPTVS